MSENEKQKGQPNFPNSKKYLREYLLDSPKNTQSEIEKIAISYCHMCINDYESWFNLNHRRWIFWQSIAIVFGVIATISGAMDFKLITTLFKEINPQIVDSLSWIRGIPAAVATVASGLLASFTYKEDAIRHEASANALWNELAKFQTRAAPYNTNESGSVDGCTDKFINNICSIIEKENNEWKFIMSNKMNK